MEGKHCMRVQRKERGRHGASCFWLSWKMRALPPRCFISHFGSSLGWHCLSSKGMGNWPIIWSMGLPEEICVHWMALFTNQELLESPGSSASPFCKGPSWDTASFARATRFVDCCVAGSQRGHRRLAASSPKASSQHPVSLQCGLDQNGHCRVAQQSPGTSSALHSLQ